MSLQSRVVTLICGVITAVLLAGAAGALGAAFLEADDSLGEALRDGGPLLAFATAMVVAVLLAARPPYGTPPERRG
jgi:hypothetical protein